MTREILEQYRTAPVEIKLLERRIYRDKEELDRLRAEGEVTDTVTGGSGGTQHFKIRGIPLGLLDKQKAILNANITRLEQRKAFLMESKTEVEDFIDGIESPEIRLVVSCRVYENMSYQDIAEMLGEGYSVDCVKQIYSRFSRKISKGDSE